MTQQDDYEKVLAHYEASLAAYIELQIAYKKLMAEYEALLVAYYKSYPEAQQVAP